MTIDDDIMRRALRAAGCGPDRNGEACEFSAGGTVATADRPVIDANCEDLAVITPRAWAVLREANDPPRLFRYGGLPSRIESDDVGTPVVKTLTTERTQHELARAAVWLRSRKVGKEFVEVAVAPPRVVIQDVLATPDPPLPVLTRIVEAPVFAEDGSLQTTPGYSPANRTYYEPADGFAIPDVPEHPSEAEVGDAVDLLLNEMLGDFPFVGQAEWAHAVACMILPFVRDMIHGPTPLHLIEKPTPGTGATLMVDALTYPAMGRPIAAMTEGRDEDEWRKRLFAKLRGGPAAVLLDNLRRKLDSAALASALTAYPAWEDRILGVSEVMRVPVRCAWIATGNNPSLSGEMTRRTIRIRLDAKQDRPWLRNGFRHPDLRTWIAENRPQIVRAVLVIVRAWLDAGRPKGQKTLGMFESWAATLGGILDVAGVRGFLGNLEEFYEQADTDGAVWRAFTAAWWTRFREQDVKVTDLLPIASDEGMDLGKDSDHGQRVRLGKVLAENRDRVFSVEFDGGRLNLRVQEGGAVKRAKLWKLQTR